MLCTKIVFLFWHSNQYLYTKCCELVFFRDFNEHSSYFGLSDSRMRASEKDLLVPGQNGINKRSIFQTFWKVHCVTKSLFFEIETSNFGSSYVFVSPLKWQGRIWPILTFWTQKCHIWGKMQICTIIPKSLFLEKNAWNFGYSHVFRSL